MRPFTISLRETDATLFAMEGSSVKGGARAETFVHTYQGPALLCFAMIPWRSSL